MRTTHFTNHYVNRIDAKGRVSVPAEFRSVLMDAGSHGFFVFPAVNEAAIEGCSQAQMGEINDMIMSLPPFSEDRDILSVGITAQSQFIQFDGDGRVKLPERYRDIAGITDQVCFVGKIDRFQLWSPEQFEAKLKAVRGRVAEHAEKIVGHSVARLGRMSGSSRDGSNGSGGELN